MGLDINSLGLGENIIVLVLKFILKTHELTKGYCHEFTIDLKSKHNPVQSRFGLGS